nr:hypothetical protein [Tanacetum cinerariifolium]
MIKKEKSEKLGRVLTEMELILEHTQQCISHEVSEKSEKLGRVPTEMELILEHTQQVCFETSDNENMLSLVILILRYQESLTHAGNHVKEVKENSKTDKIGSKPDKNGKRGEAGKSQKQLQKIEQEKLKKTQKEGPKMKTHSKFYERKKIEGLKVQFCESSSKGVNYAKDAKLYNQRTAHAIRIYLIRGQLCTKAKVTKKKGLTLLVHH